MIDHGRPLYGICLGHQLLGRALGLETFKLPFGHRGANHPVFETESGRVLVTSQNHGFAVQGARERRRRPRGHAPLALRRHRRGPAPARPAGLEHAVPPRGLAGTARRAREAVGVRRGLRRAGRGERLMPRRDDLTSIAIIGSGPIVIGQACEFDYSGVQALKVLREEGYRTVLVNSNPATIMTDPDWADATYLEPLDLEGVTGVLRRERPDALLPTLGGQTALNLAMELERAGVLAELEIELIGASAKAIHTAEDREAFGEAMASVGLRVPRSVIVRTPEEARAAHRAASSSCPSRSARPSRSAATAAASRARADELDAIVAARSQREPDLAGAGRGVGRGLGRVRARGDPRPARQRRHRLLDREPRSDGRAHRRLGLLRAGDDALRPRVPGAARRRGQGHPRRRRRDGRLQRAVRGQPRERRDRRDRDEPARLALLGAGLEGDRLPDREGRHAARDRLHARRDPQRHHAARRRPPSSRRSTTSSSRRRASRSRSSPAPTRR